jgi:hypothetical protein
LSPDNSSNEIASTGTMAGIIFGTPGAYTLRLYIENECSVYPLEPPIVSKYINAGWGSYMNVYPNPATDVVPVEMTTEKEKTGAADSLNKLSTGELYEIQLWNSEQLLHSYKTSDEKFNIPLSGLPAGTYFVRIIRDGETYSQVLIKE